MIKLKKLLLLEVHLEDLFHATYHTKLLKMMTDNAIKLAFAGGTQADMNLNRGFHFFLSTSRVKYGNWAGGDELGPKTITRDVVINLNGRALTAAGYKVFPVDFWGAGPDKSEQEERIVSNKDEIPFSSKFIKSIHVYLAIDPTHANSFTLERLHEINKLAKTINIPIYFYPTEQGAYFKSQRIEKAVRDIDTLIPKPEWSKDDLEHKEFLKNYPRSNSTLKLLQLFIDVYNEVPIDTKTYPGKSLMNWLLYYPHYAYSQLSCAIHNLKTDHPPIFRELVKIIKKEKLSSVKELIKLVMDREQAKEKIRRDAEMAKWKKTDI